MARSRIEDLPPNVLAKLESLGRPVGPPRDLTRRRTWEGIDGWFNWEWLIRDAVKEAPAGASFVEVGCWMGRSVVCLASHVRESGKKLRVYAVDNWTGVPGYFDDLHAAVAAGGRSTYDAFNDNLRTRGLSDVVTPVVMNSLDAARTFADESLYYVFLDAEHTREAVAADVAAWLPKITTGGWIGGHDYAGQVVLGVADGLAALGRSLDITVRTEPPIHVPVFAARVL